MADYLYGGFKNFETDLIATVLYADIKYWKEEIVILRSNGLNTVAELSQELETRFKRRADAFKNAESLNSKLDVQLALSDELNLHEPPPETPRTWLRELLMIQCLQGAINWKQLVLLLVPEDDELDE